MAKILVIEDNDDARSMWVFMLRAEGYEVCDAGDGQEGLECAQAEKPDLILTDLSMPRMSGIEMIRALRARPDLAHIKIIAMSAYELERRNLALQAGAEHVLSKPIDPAQILSTIQQLLRA